VVGRLSVVPGGRRGGGGVPQAHVRRLRGG
jgi:hypothetical protein